VHSYQCLVRSAEGAAGERFPPGRGERIGTPAALLGRSRPGALNKRRLLVARRFRFSACSDLNPSYSPVSRSHDWLLRSAGVRVSHLVAEWEQ
jgi:hypothetical protein